MAWMTATANTDSVELRTKARFWRLRPPWASLDRTCAHQNAEIEPRKVDQIAIKSFSVGYGVSTGRARDRVGSSSQSRCQGSTCQTLVDPTSAPAPAATARAGSQDYHRSWRSVPTQA